MFVEIYVVANENKLSHIVKILEKSIFKSNGSLFFFKFHIGICICNEMYTEQNNKW